MSGRERWGRVPESVLADGRLSARDLRVYGALAVHADKAGRCWPKRERIAEITGIAPRNITLATSRLREFGHVEKVGKGGHSRPAHYLLTGLKKGVNADRVSEQEPCHSGTGFKGVNSDGVSGRKGVNADRGNEQTLESPHHSPNQDSPNQDLQDYALLLDVMELFNESLPSLPPARMASAQVEQDFALLIEKEPAAAALPWWRDYFAEVKRSEFLMGKKEGKQWMASFGWLLKADNAAKVLNGQYRDAEGKRRRKSLEEQMDETDWMRGAI